jgi:hypothetical protein
VRESYGNAEQYKKAWGSIFSFRSFVRSWTSVRINKIYSFVPVLRGTVKEGGGAGGRERERERNIRNGICQYDYWRIIWIDLFELICTYLHFAGTESVPTYQGLSKFFKMYYLLGHLNIKFWSL